MKAVKKSLFYFTAGYFFCLLGNILLISGVMELFVQSDLVPFPALFVFTGALILAFGFYLETRCKHRYISGSRG